MMADPSEETVHTTSQVREKLPDGTVDPEMFSLPTGEMALNWHYSIDHEFTILVNGDRIFWSAEYDGESLSGKTDWECELPEELISAMNKVDCTEPLK